MGNWNYQKAERKRQLSRFIVSNLHSKSIADIVANFTFWPLIDYVVARFCGVSTTAFVGTSIIGGVAGIVCAPPYGWWIDFTRRFIYSGNLNLRKFR